MNPGDRFAAVRGGFLRRGLYRTNRLRDFGILSYSADLRPGGRIWLSRPLEWLVCVPDKNFEVQCVAASCCGDSDRRAAIWVFTLENRAWDQNRAWDRR